MNKKVICSFFFVLLFSYGFSQKIIKVTGIKGVSFISDNISPNQAKQQALDDAKINALKSAGIGENINSYQLLFNSQQKNEYSDFFSSVTQSEILGAIQSYEITNQATTVKDNNIQLEITIDASVIEYTTKPDINFDVFIDGIKGVYNNFDKLTFSLKTTQPCYLTIFNITDTEASMMYPNSYEKQKLLSPNELFKFPLAQVNYELETNDMKMESNKLIFVFTKTAVPYIKMDAEQITTTDAIFNWIYSIMPDQRKVEYYSLVIQK
jgi:hypothetical protein